MGALLRHRGGDHPLAGGRAGEPLLALLVVAELGQQQRRGAVHRERDRCDPATDLDQHAAQLDEPEPGAAVLLGQVQREQTGGAEVAPQLGVEPVAGVLDGCHPVGGGAVAEDLRRERAASSWSEVKVKSMVGPLYRFAAGRPRPT